MKVNKCNTYEDVNCMFAKNNPYIDEGRLYHHTSTPRAPKPSKSWRGAKEKDVSGQNKDF